MPRVTASATQGSTTTPDSQATPTDAAWALSTRTRIRTSRPRFWRLAERRKSGARIVAPGSRPSITIDFCAPLRDSAASRAAGRLRSGLLRAKVLLTPSVEPASSGVIMSRLSRLPLLALLACATLPALADEPRYNQVSLRSEVRSEERRVVKEGRSL